MMTDTNNSATKHTAGRFQANISEAATTFHIETEGGGKVLGRAVFTDRDDAPYMVSRDEAAANAKLWAASPELLELAQAFIDWNNDVNGDGHGLDRILRMAKRVHAKATK
jgi:hypothetical protein